MQTSFRASDGGQAVIQNTTTIGTETLVVNLHPGSDSMIEVQIREDGPGEGQMVSSTISINQNGMQQLVEWLRNQGVVD
ncbi:MAG TPA: hypothetical protein VGE12_21825 [Noviherbaspirillum sp.]